jgi:hypothetical protein
MGLVVLSCHTPTDTYRKLLIVSATLDPGAPSQRIVVDHSYRLSDSADENCPGIRDAEVKLWPNNAGWWDTVRLEPHWDFGKEGQIHWEYRTDRWLHPCSTYEVSVSWRDIEEQKDFFGHMSITLPDTFSITSPRQRETLTSASLPVFSWRRSAGALCYVLLAHTDVWFDDSTGEVNGWSGTSYPYVTQDTSIDDSAYFRDVFFSQSAPTTCMVEVYAWNDDMYRQKITRANRFAMDTIGADVIADYGAQTSDYVIVTYLPEGEP